MRAHLIAGGALLLSCLFSWAGDINPRARTPWEILGVSHTATLQEIKVAYRQAVRIYHPDLAGRDSVLAARMTEDFKIITNAYNVLKISRTVDETVDSKSAFRTSKQWEEQFLRQWAEIESSLPTSPKQTIYRWVLNSHTEASGARDATGSATMGLRFAAAAVIKRKWPSPELDMSWDYGVDEEMIKWIASTYPDSNPLLRALRDELMQIVYASLNQRTLVRVFVVLALEQVHANRALDPHAFRTLMKRYSSITGFRGDFVAVLKRLLGLGESDDGSEDQAQARDFLSSTGTENTAVLQRALVELLFVLGNEKSIDDVYPDMYRIASASQVDAVTREMARRRILQLARKKGLARYLSEVATLELVRVVPGCSGLLAPR